MANPVSTVNPMVESGEQHEDAKSSEIAHGEGRPVHIRDVPHLVHRTLGRQSETDRPVEEEQTPDDNGDDAPGQRMDLRLQLVTDDGKGPEGAVDQVLAKPVVVVKDVAEDRREQHQEREEGEEAVVGEEGGLAACLVVPELLHDGEGEPNDTVSLLEIVRPADGCLQPARALPSRYRRGGIHTWLWRTGWWKIRNSHANERAHDGGPRRSRLDRGSKIVPYLHVDG